MNGFSLIQIKDILQGDFYTEVDRNFIINNFEITASHLDGSLSSTTAFISISKTRWNHAMQKQTTWIDGSLAILPNWEKCSLIITESPIVELKGKVAQLIVRDSYEVLQILAIAARETMVNPVIGITGSAGKSSTRLMLECMVDNQKKVVATRGNHNTQAGVLLYGTKLASNPDYGILEISLNALNNIGNQSLHIRPTVAIITSIGEAHLSTLHSKENITRFKSRIIDGLIKNGLMIINKDIDSPLYEILFEKAKQKTDHIVTYSLKDSSATIYLKSKIVFKHHTEVIFCYKDTTHTLLMNIPSEGMILNAFGAILCLAELGQPIEKIIPRLRIFNSLDRVMELKKFKTSDFRQVEVIDDSHNASIPAMKNAIQTFKDKKKFYQGRTILVLGQVADLGKRSQELHDSLINSITEAEPDIVFGHGQYMKNVIRKLPAKMVGGWFNNAKDLTERLPYYCSNDSLILLKGSVSGSDFRQISHLLPIHLNKSNVELKNFSSETLVKHLRPMWGLTISDLKNGSRILEKGSIMASSLEGLGPILLLFLVLEKTVNLDQIILLKQWPTNKGNSINGKSFIKGQLFSIRELLNELIKTQHPSAIYQLADIFYLSSNHALSEVQKYARQLNLPEKTVVNLTGRYRVKEQQSYDLKDLQKLGIVLYQSNIICQKLAILNESADFIPALSFGQLRKSYIGIHDHFVICQLGTENEDRQQLIVKSAIQDIVHLQKSSVPDGG